MSKFVSVPHFFWVPSKAIKFFPFEKFFEKMIFFDQKKEILMALSKKLSSYHLQDTGISMSGIPAARAVIYGSYLLDLRLLSRSMQWSINEHATKDCIFPDSQI